MSRERDCGGSRTEKEGKRRMGEGRGRERGTKGIESEKTVESGGWFGRKVGSWKNEKGVGTG